MTTTNPMERAAEILRDAARSLRIVHTSSRAPGDWAGEDEAKAAHDEYLAVADALERQHMEGIEQARLLGISAEREMTLRARVQELERELSSIGAGGVEPLRQRGVRWLPVAERLPEPGTPVLLDIGKKFPIRAMWAPAKTLEATMDDDPVGDYDEATDTYYSPEGWYEWNAHEECHWFVHDAPRAWMALPEQVRARGAQGGSNDET